MPVPATIEQTIPLPPAPGQPAGPDDSIHVAADPRREYLVGGGLAWYANRVRALPPWVDVVARDYPGAYQEMLLDAQVSSTLNLRRLAALAQSWALVVPPGTADDDPQAETIRAFCEADYRRLRTPLPRVLFELLGALAFGYAPAEQIYDYGADGKLHLVNIKPKACEDVVIFVDAFGNEVGYLPAALVGRAGGGVPFTPGQQDANGAPVELYDRRKLIIHKYQPTARHLLGQSALRPAWEDWWFKQQLDPEYLKYVVQFATPIPHGQTDPDAKPYKERDPATGLPLPGGKLIYPEDALGEALAKLHNGAYIVTTGKSDVKFLYVQGDGAVFREAYDHKDRAIAKAVLYQTLATEEAQHMARAASDTHQDVLDMVIAADRGDLEATMTRESCYPLVFYNFGQAAADQYTPQFQLGEVAHQDFASDATAVAKLNTAGVLHRSMLPGIRAMLNLPPADPEQEQADYERGQAAPPAPQDGQDGQDGQDNPDGTDATDATDSEEAPRE